MAKPTNAIAMLEQQHREVEELFDHLDQAEDPEEKQTLFDELADKLVLHAAIEEQHLYPALRAGDTETAVREAEEEHLAIKRLLADLVELDVEDATFSAKLEVLKERVEHHIDEEERQLFPQAIEALDEGALAGIASEMAAMVTELEDEEPRFSVLAERGLSAVS